MIEYIRFTNVYSSSSLVLNHITTTPYYPVHHFDTEIQRRKETRERPASDGLWPTYPYDGGMEINIEGAILANDSSDYNSKRNTMMNILRYRAVPRIRIDGTLFVKFDGVTNEVYDPVVLDTVDCAREGLSPSYSLYRITFLSYTPYFMDTISNDPYYDE